MTLEQRVLAILLNEKKSSVYENYKHILAREILSGDSMQTSFDENDLTHKSNGIENCGTDLWTGVNGVVWLDLRAEEGMFFEKFYYI